MSPVVVVDDVSPVVRTGDVDRIRYRGSGVVSVSKTKHSVLSVACIGDIEGITKEPACITVLRIYKVDLMHVI